MYIYRSIHVVHRCICERDGSSTDVSSWSTTFRVCCICASSPRGGLAAMGNPARGAFVNGLHSLLPLARGAAQQFRCILGFISGFPNRDFKSPFAGVRTFLVQFLSLRGGVRIVLGKTSACSHQPHASPCNCRFLTQTSPPYVSCTLTCTNSPSAGESGGTAIFCS